MLGIVGDTDAAGRVAVSQLQCPYRWLGHAKMHIGVSEGMYARCLAVDWHPTFLTTLTRIWLIQNNILNIMT